MAVRWFGCCDDDLLLRYDVLILNGELHESRHHVNGTQAPYCKGYGVAGPGVNYRYLSVYNDFFAYEAEDSSRDNYAYLKKVNADPAACTECKKCEDLCPQHLPITHHLKEAKALFEESGK